MGILIRTLEMFITSAVPSMLCVWLAIYKFNENIAWRYACLLAFFVSLAGHIWFWRKDVILSRNDSKAFYIVNLSAFAVFAALIPIFMNDFIDAEVFSAVYASLRGFEIFRLPTVLSVIISLAIMLIALFLTKRIIGKRGDMDMALMQKENEMEID